MEKPNHAEPSQSRHPIEWDQGSISRLPERLTGVLDVCRGLTRKRGIHSHIAIKSAGFTYTNNGDIARCHTCGLEVSGWTSDMKPFAIHLQRSPTCLFVLSMLPSREPIARTATDICQTVTILGDNIEPSSLRNNVQANKTCQFITLFEVESLKQARKRTFSHWIHRASPSTAQMIEAGFFNCNVGDRVICIYCNLICQQWTPYSDDPCEIHKTLSPKCIYVTGILNRPRMSPTLHASETSTNSDSRQIDLRLNQTACNTWYVEAKTRHASFALWPAKTLPSADDLVEAGFFYTGVKTIVTCFYCNGSLQNWNPRHKPIIEHARWFPHCAYAKQLCGAELYRKIQESKRAQQGFFLFHYHRQSMLHTRF
jgi:hypothetical protein